MKAQQAQLRTFKPRASGGWLSLMLMGLVIMAFGIAPGLATGLGSVSAILTLIVCIPLAFSCLLLALWFPTMRYELKDSELILRYGPVLAYRIPLREIHAIRRRSLSLTIWSCIRFPGVALFTVPYGDVGNVKMCATAALNRILLIESGSKKYGITPQDEEEFVTSIQAQMET